MMPKSSNPNLSRSDPPRESWIRRSLALLSRLRPILPTGGLAVASIAAAMLLSTADTTPSGLDEVDAFTLSLMGDLDDTNDIEVRPDDEIELALWQTGWSETLIFEHISQENSAPS